MSKDFKHTKQTGFKTPSDYFNNLEEAVFDKLNAKSNLDSIDNPGFGVPNDYFSTFESKVMDTIKNDEKETKVVSLLSRRNLLYMSGIAASVVLMFSIFVNKTETVTDELDYELLANYIIEQNVSSYEIATLLTEDEITNINSEITQEAFNEDDMEAYLLENVDFENIIEQ